MRESLKVSLFFFVIFIFLPQTLFHKNIQSALCTYQTLFHKSFYSVRSVLTKHYFTKTFTVCALNLSNIISQKLLQCVLHTYQTLFHKNIILNKNCFITVSWLSNLSTLSTPMDRWLNRCCMRHKQLQTLTLCQQH